MVGKPAICLKILCSSFILVDGGLHCVREMYFQRKITMVLVKVISGPRSLVAMVSVLRA